MRAFFLLQHADRIDNTVRGLANSMNEGMGGAPADKMARRDVIALSGEISAAFVRYASVVQPFALEYDPNMSEAALRAWARDLVATLKD